LKYLEELLLYIQYFPMKKKDLSQLACQRREGKRERERERNLIMKKIN
jgi:hypothetical protein